MAAAGMIEAPALAAVPGIRHGFFTRTGGVSPGIYASLNGGIGSRDSAANVAQNRARMAAALGVRPRVAAHRLPDPFGRPWSPQPLPGARTSARAPTPS